MSNELNVLQRREAFELAERLPASPEKYAFEIIGLRASLAFANQLLAVHNLAVCYKHAVSWKLDAYKSCPECEDSNGCEGL